MVRDPVIHDHHKEVHGFAKDGLDKLYKESGIPSHVNVQMFFKDKNRIQIRLENLDDSFDGEQGHLRYATVDMLKLVENLFVNVNLKQGEESVTIHEQSIDGS
jgi:hypothetical protein